MMGQLITLPLRLTACTASFVLRSSEEVLKRALALTGRAVEAEPRYSAPAPSSPPPASRPAAPVRPRPVQPPTPSPSPWPSPAHVSQEAVLVEEFAEPGAEDGAGAQIRVDPPWDGYAQLSAKQVIAHLRGADVAELIAVNLYENAHRARQTVLSAVKRQLAERGNAPS